MKRVYPDDKPVFEDGFYMDLEIERYHEDPALSKTGAVKLARSPLTYLLDRLEGEDKKKDFLDIGSLAHAMILEPHTVDEKFKPIPKEVLSKSGSRTGKKYEEWLAALPQGTTAVLQKNFDIARRIRDNVHENPEHEKASILCSGHTEVSFFYTDSIYGGIRKKVRPDAMPGGPILTDLKTARSAEFWAFGSQAFNLKYHWSAAMSLEVVSAVTGDKYNEYYFVVVENELPYDVQVFKPEPIHIAMAEDDLYRIFSTYEECYFSNRWPGYPIDVQPLFFPRKAMRSWQPREESMWQN